jgi:hypothetical protein
MTSNSVLHHVQTLTITNPATAAIVITKRAARAPHVVRMTDMDTNAVGRAPRNQSQ